MSVSSTGSNAAGGGSALGGIVTSIVVPTAVGALLAGNEVEWRGRRIFIERGGNFREVHS